MTNNEIFETINNNLLTNYNNQLKKIKKLKEQLLIAEQSQDNKKVAICAKRINSILESNNNIKSILSCIRPNKESDLRERNEIRNNFSTFFLGNNILYTLIISIYIKMSIFIFYIA